MSKSTLGSGGTAPAYSTAAVLYSFFRKV